ncbi:hypothetical protein SLS56_011784 [Neofusicoccum ribis]|uniref:Rhodopsin domain-containing protein n=1 Tax=Neofusicoccum ribis TaxID=45134 RepID=A0ABR3SAP8_9PEZI
MPAVILPRIAQNVPDKGPRLEAITTALLVLATFFVILRFVARYRRGLTYGPDDWMMVVSLENLVMVLKLLVAFECVYCTAVALVKLSLLLMYMRIFPTKGFKIGAYILGFMTIGWCIAINCVSIFQCHPIKKAWLPTIPGSCINLKASFIGNAVPNILTDVAILCMPIGQVWKLQVTPTQRASLCFMFLLGSFVLFASIYRFTTIMQFQLTDTTWTLATACTWCVVEVASGIISACLPTLRPLMKMVSSQFGSSRGRSGKGTTGNLSRNTELVTIGGTGAKRSQTGERHFKRLDDELVTVVEEGSHYGNSTMVTRSHSAQHSDGSSSSDQVPLTSIMVTKDVQWSERNASVSESRGSSTTRATYQGQYQQR